ncbi:hypothetical protein SELMODRAFT_444189 [Selaginella moellendorffii]|uniref:RNA polymerase II subunit B1 CTD phosphatase RPAP2 homolog n=1 Tax=Selaginella moellendorffii TaxID=88036 RepID=D8S7Q6_SELML|nr:putative RNA polymerase II subunit B1 CTD phosphatase RPAP2 homolog isoform X1 [Selaginella moellendorffii]EFJ19793.1 hypothetical protein SELMODRAFT_444189 [Selaginella moellendorffii]|eukprot:XP_002979385.1 putative RNA polymerase II subunit B1 CTD phosphatase RPAP2 homolog isoform X1 [Selaginella moellendorffii]
MPSLLPILSYDVPIQGEIPPLASNESSSIVFRGEQHCSSSSSVLKKHTTVCRELPEKKKKHVKAAQGGVKSHGEGSGGHSHPLAESVVSDSGDAGEGVAKAQAVAEAVKVMKKAVFAIQMALYNGLRSDFQLKAATCLLTQSEYADVVTERSNDKQCGFPLCPNSLKVEKARKGRYHISLREHKVYDLEETRAFCSTGCAVSSKTYAASLPSNHEGIMEHQKLEEIIACVRGLSLATTATTATTTVPAAASAGKMSASAQDSDGVVVRERTDCEPGDLEFQLSRSASIEGYVPRAKPQVQINDSSKPLKSAMKQSPRKNQRITWADEIPAAVAQPDVDDSFTFSTTVTVTSEGERLGAAQVVADALAQAANVSSLGEVEPCKAAATAGLEIVSPYEKVPETFEFDATKEAKEEEDEEEREDLISRSSWYSAPPKPYKAEVSPFGLLWMALDEWVSSGTLAHIYGRDDEEFRDVNGRVPVDGDGSSSPDILRTISSCVSRVLPDVVQALAIAEPLSVIERAVGRLLGTMHFSQALPAFTTKHWRMIAALFLDALSVHRLPGLGGQMTNNRALLRKLIIDSGMNDPEYESFKELLLPLGRLPAFASGGGG